MKHNKCKRYWPIFFANMIAIGQQSNPCWNMMRCETSFASRMEELSEQEEQIVLTNIRNYLSTGWQQLQAGIELIELFRIRRSLQPKKSSKLRSSKNLAERYLLSILTEERLRFFWRSMRTGRILDMDGLTSRISKICKKEQYCTTFWSNRNPWKILSDMVIRKTFWNFGTSCWLERHQINSNFSIPPLACQPKKKDRKGLFGLLSSDPRETRLLKIFGASPSFILRPSIGKLGRTHGSLTSNRDPEYHFLGKMESTLMKEYIIWFERKRVCFWRNNKNFFYFFSPFFSSSRGIELYKKKGKNTLPMFNIWDSRMEERSIWKTFV